MRIRFRFAKREPLQYLGHLDVMRFFQKALRRSALPVRYSEGFSPHMLLSFASPLGVGKTSEGEYFDVEMTEPVCPSAAVERLNKEMVEGMEVLDASAIGEGKRANGMRMIAAASYRITLPSDFLETVRGHVDDLLSRDTILVMQKSKKGEKEKDIRPGIYTIRCEEDALYLFVSASSAQNIRPESVLQALAQLCGCEIPSLGVRICRLEMYADRGSEDAHDFCSLLDIGKEEEEPCKN